MNNYLKRKTDELKLLDKNISVDNKSSIDNMKYIMDQKLKGQAELKTNFINNTYNYRNTSRNEQKIVFNNLECAYGYQRYDIKIKQKDFLKTFYDLNNNDYEYIFTNCGMSALFSTFYALNKLSYSIEYVGNIYVETERLLDNYIKINDNGFDKKVLFVDTVCFNSLSDIINSIELDKYEMFLIDTTLYLYDELKSLIKKLENLKKPIILLKSHIKLDMLGNEWSKLGSVCIINVNKSFMNLILKEIKIVLSFIGGYAYCEDIPLFFSNLDYKEITYKRNKVIKSNTEYIYNKLKNTANNYTIIKPYHNLFILIKPQKFIDYKKLEEDLHTFANNSKLKGLICYADSFGLDCFGINGYYENMSAETEVIRISPSDYPLEICDLIVEEIINWLNIYLSDDNKGEL